MLTCALGIAAISPLEKTLGIQARAVYFHGAWVWVAILVFLAAALVGLAGLLWKSKPELHAWSRALGRSGLCFWITFLPMSLYIMQANWNGLFLDEPRFRTPLNLAIVGLLLQMGLTFLPPAWTSLANLGFGITLLGVMSRVQNILHPDAPIFNSNAGDIQLFYLALLATLLCAAWHLTRWWRSLEPAAGQARP